MQRTAEALSLKVAPDAIDALVEAIGADSARLESELRKLSLRDSSISAARVQELVGGTLHQCPSRGGCPAGGQSR